MRTASESFDEFVVCSASRLVRTAYLLTGDRHLAEDLTQTVLAKTYLRWHRLRDPGAAETYARRVMVSTFGKWRNRRWRGEIPAEQLPDRPDDDAYGDADTRELLRRALATLPPAQRAVLVLRYFEDLGEEEVAAILGCSRGTVKSRTSRALAGLRHLDLLDSERATFPRVVAVEQA